VTRREIARRYARALIKSAIDYVWDDVHTLREVALSSEEFREMLSDPLIPPHQKSEAMKKLFEGKLHRVTLNFLDTLIERRREAFLPEILEVFDEELDRHEGVTLVTVITAVPLTAEQERRITEKVKTVIGGEIRLETEVDPSIKGGMLIRVGDTTIDATISTALQRLKEHLLSRIREG